MMLTVRPSTETSIEPGPRRELGVALLLPVVPTAVAGAGLAAFSAGLPGLVSSDD